MTTAFVFIIFALILYSAAIWSERFIGFLTPQIILVFAVGFSCDIYGTSSMFQRMSDKLSLISYIFHSLVGCGALIIMGLHLVWAFLAFFKKGKYQIYFSRYSLVAWGVWLAAFISGALVSSLGH